MARDVKDIQTQLNRLEASKYNVRAEGFKGFLKGAWRPLITFGVIGLGLGVALTGIGAIVSVPIISSLSAGSSIALVTGVTAGGATLLSGGASALKSVRQASERNETIDTMEGVLENFARQEGVDVTPPSVLKEREQADKRLEKLSETPSANGRPKFLDDILQSGKNTLDPKEIIKQGLENAREGMGIR